MQLPASRRLSARSRPANTQILYLAFDEGVQQEAIRKFAAQGVPDMQVETTHFLAYRHMVKHSDYQLHTTGSYESYKLAALLSLPKMTNVQAYTDYVVAMSLHLNSGSKKQNSSLSVAPINSFG